MSSEHLVDWDENEHKKKPKDTGCIWRHADYKTKKFPRCNYRKNAHDYSKASEPHIYNVPSFRSPRRWVQVWLENLGPTYTKAGTEIEGTSPPPPKNGEWDLGKSGNFQDWKKPYWHNTHHCIACGEILESFNESETKLLLTTKWNINEMPNVIILPKQYVVARILKLPTHVPPDGPAEHAGYSMRLGTGLNRLKSSLSQNAEESGHTLTDATAPDCKRALENVSKQLRDMIIQSGEKNPGVNLDNLNLEGINWSAG